MDRHYAMAGLLPAMLLFACAEAETTPERGTLAAAGPATTAPAAARPIVETSSPPAGYTKGSGINEGYPDLAPKPLAPEAERTEKGATNVLMAFARAIELKEFDQAWALLSEADQLKWPKAEFTRMFADLGLITVDFAGGEMEGAVGSSFYTAPLDITASDKDGREVRIEGHAVLRRVNDVEGATPEQLRWRLSETTLDWTH